MDQRSSIQSPGGGVAYKLLREVESLGYPAVTGYDTIEHACLTDVGVRRSHNQDNHAALLATDLEQWQGRGHIFLVADGMGAHAVGELASKLAVDIIPHTYSKHAQEGAAAALRKAFVEANLSIHARGQQNPEFEGMGTTGTALLIRPEGVWVGHVGDSRAYRIRGGQIEQLSFDHSLHWELARRQRIDPEKLQGIPSNVIVRSLGPEPLVQVDVEGPHPIAPGDIYVLCSDGLSGPLSDHEIGAVASVLPPAEACRFMVDLANLRGGPDNITVIIVRVDGESQDGEVMQPARNRTPLHRRIPWPFAALGLGVLLAAGAAWLTYKEVWGGVPAFLLAAVSLAAGLVGLLVNYKQEKEQLANQPEPPRIQVYSHASCRIERPLLDKLARAEGILQQRVRDKQWDVDWATLQYHHDQAVTHLNQGALPDTFREYCRALGILTEALLKQHNREEVFQPVWDKTHDS
jgi:PPM family protein phosphatase